MTKERIAELRALYMRTVDADWGGMATNTFNELSEVHEALLEALDAIDETKQALAIAMTWRDPHKETDDDMARILELVGE
jgi:hypothetical protein